MLSWLAWGITNTAWMYIYLFVCFLSNRPTCVGESLQVITAEADIRKLKT